jgi:hypothetical protein
MSAATSRETNDRATTENATMPSEPSIGRALVHPDPRSGSEISGGVGISHGRAGTGIGHCRAGRPDQPHVALGVLAHPTAAERR